MVKKSLVELAQEGMSFGRAATFVSPRHGKRVHASTVMRWAHDGVIGPDGERIWLATLRVGGRRGVTLAALEEFLAKLNADTTADDPETEADIARHNRETRAALAALGIGSADEIEADVSRRVAVQNRESPASGDGDDRQALESLGVGSAVPR